MSRVPYQKHSRLPAAFAHCPAISEDKRPDLVPLRSDTSIVKWSGLSRHVPRIDTEVRVRINSMERATVRRYFTEDGWLGLVVVLHKPPHWWVKQNGRSRTAHVFGNEIDIPCRYCDGMDGYEVGEHGKCVACDGTHVHPIDDDPDADLTEIDGRINAPAGRDITEANSPNDEGMIAVVIEIGKATALPDRGMSTRELMDAQSFTPPPGHPGHPSSQESRRAVLAQCARDTIKRLEQALRDGYQVQTELEGERRRLMILEAGL